MGFLQKVYHIQEQFDFLSSSNDFILNSIVTLARGSSYSVVRHLSSHLLKLPPSGSKSLSTTMATKDTSLQSDISKLKTEPDGSFKRADASFRNMIAKGSQFEPENGGFKYLLHMIGFA